MRIGIGTVHFGMEYGLPGDGRRSGWEEVRALLELAEARDVRVLDTAPIYGEAEALLGELVAAERPFRVVTKTRPAGPGGHLRGAARAGLEASLERLGRDRADALLVHVADDLLGPGGDELFEELGELVEDGLAGRLGVSVYEPAELEAVFERFPLELVQLPLNALDRRFAEGGHLAELRRRGVEVHARSVFLRGLLLVDGAPPPEFRALAPALAAWRARLREHGVTALEAALGYVLAQEVDVALVGVEDRAQLAQVLAAAAREHDAALLAPVEGVEPALLDPRRWPA